MKTTYLLLFILFFQPLMGEIPDSNREELLGLLKERKDRFGNYSESLSKSSGIFGNRTKNDIRNSSNRLVEILEMDNRIMNALQRMLEYKSFEKQTLKLDLNSYENRIQNLSVLNDTLNKQTLLLIEQNKELQKKLRSHTIYFILLIVLLIATLGLWIRKIVKS
jgi:hypothetical protein